MPTMIPRRLRTADAPLGEREVHTALARLGDDQWVVLHSVAWQGIRDGRPDDGEADFVLLHPDHGLVVIEVKGGGVSLERGTWMTVDRNGATHVVKDPFRQAVDSKHSLIRYLKEVVADLPFLPAGHAVVFPDLPGPVDAGPGADRAITLTKPALADVDAAVKSVTDHWEMRDAGLADVMDDLVDALAPSRKVRVLLRDTVAEANAQLITLTTEQLRVLDTLRRNRRAVVFGSAGTGKTVLAAEKARRLAADGHRVLLTCFNRPLADHLRPELADSKDVYVYSFHALCRWQAGSAGLDFPSRPPAEWWEEDAWNLLVEAAATTGFSVDAVVVDEGQDFAPGWFEALEMLTGEPDAATFYVFADPRQAIYRDDWSPPFPGPAADLVVNCRNTNPIAERVSAVFGDHPATLSADGPIPEIIAVENEAGAVAALRGVLHRLVNEGRLDHGQVVVLSERRSLVDELRGSIHAGVRLVAPGGEGVTMETVHRFKGLEADAVVLILDEATERSLTLAYIGMSRARTHLTVLAPESAIEATGGT